MTPLLECRGLDVSYGQVQVLFDVDFAVDEGEIVALLGTNGAGKSTLLKAAAGLVRPTKGAVTFAGADITGQAADVVARSRVTDYRGCYRPGSDRRRVENDDGRS